MADLVDFAIVTAKCTFVTESSQGTAVLVLIAHRISSMNNVIFLQHDTYFWQKHTKLFFFLV